MTRPVIISQQAETDFEDIYLQTVSEFGKATANKLFYKFINFKEIVSLYPFVFGYYYRSRSIRKYVLTKSILVLYRVSKTQIEIIGLVFTKESPRLVKRRLRKK